MIQLRLLPLNGHIWKQYTMFLGARRARAPLMQPDGVFVGLPDQTLIAGVLLYPTGGEYVFAENMTTNPMVPLKVRHRAVYEVIDGVVRYCAIRGKHPMLHIRHKSLAKMLNRYGFVAQPTVVMTLYPAPIVAQIDDAPAAMGGSAEASRDIETNRDPSMPTVSKGYGSSKRRKA